MLLSALGLRVCSLIFPQISLPSTVFAHSNSNTFTTFFPIFQDNVNYISYNSSFFMFFYYFIYSYKPTLTIILPRQPRTPYMHPSHTHILYINIKLHCKQLGEELRAVGLSHTRLSKETLVMKLLALQVCLSLGWVWVYMVISLC